MAYFYKIGTNCNSTGTRSKRNAGRSTWLEVDRDKAVQVPQFCTQLAAYTPKSQNKLSHLFDQRYRMSFLVFGMGGVQGALRYLETADQTLNRPIGVAHSLRLNNAPRRRCLFFSFFFTLSLTLRKGPFIMLLIHQGLVQATNAMFGSDCVIILLLEPSYAITDIWYQRD